MEVAGAAGCATGAAVHPYTRPVPGCAGGGGGEGVVHDRAGHAARTPVAHCDLQNQRVRGRGQGSVPPYRRNRILQGVGLDDIEVNRLGAGDDDGGGLGRPILGDHDHADAVGSHAEADRARGRGRGDRRTVNHDGCGGVGHRRGDGEATHAVDHVGGVGEGAHGEGGAEGAVTQSQPAQVGVGGGGGRSGIGTGDGDGVGLDRPVLSGHYDGDAVGSHGKADRARGRGRGHRRTVDHDGCGGIGHRRDDGDTPDAVGDGGGVTGGSHREGGAEGAITESQSAQVGIRGGGSRRSGGGSRRSGGGGCRSISAGDGNRVGLDRPVLRGHHHADAVVSHAEADRA